MSEAAIISRLDRIERKLSAILGDKKKETWVKVKSIMEITGWDSVQLRRMRENGLIAHKKNSTGIWYMVESINPTLIRIATQRDAENVFASKGGDGNNQNKHA